MKKLAFWALSVFLILSLISCGSKKGAEDTAEPEPPAVEETVDEKIEETVNEAVSQAEIDLALANMDKARQNAIDSDAEEYAPDFFDSLEEEYEELRKRADNGEDVTAECNDLAKRYEALAAYVKALDAKETIDDYELPPLAKAAYDKGCKDLDDFEALFDDENAKSDDLLAKATSAYGSFKTVLVALYKDIAKDARADALEAKKDADSVKAGVSEKREYTRAVELFKKGDASYSMNGYEAACDAYDEAYDIFSTLYETIYDKRLAALEAIEAAKKSVEESAQVAEEADLEAPLTGEVDGIEDEDAVLLEEDNYANPEDAEIYLSEELSVGGDAK